MIRYNSVIYFTEPFWHPQDAAECRKLLGNFCDCHCFQRNLLLHGRIATEKINRFYQLGNGLLINFNYLQLSTWSKFM